MGLTYQELLNKIDSLLDKKFSGLDGELSSKVNAKFTELSTAISDLKRTNSKLIEINSALIEQNKKLRAHSCEHEVTYDGDVYVGEEVCAGAGDVIGDVTLDARSADADVGRKCDRVTKKFYDTLILSDSIYRHVGTECPKENYPAGLPFASYFTVGNVSVMKVICPGARCDRLLSLAAELNMNYSFGHTILHVGANYTRSVTSPHDVSDEINALMDAVGALYDCKFSFSCMLPQSNQSVTGGINIVNTEVSDFCLHRGYGFLQCTLFVRREGRNSLLAYDGIHLSRKGVRALHYCVEEHIKYEHKHRI